MSLSAIGVLILREGTQHHDYVLAYHVGALALLAAAAAWAYGNIIYTRRREGAPGSVAEPQALRALGVITTILGVAALIVASRS